VAEILVGRGDFRPSPPPTFVENDEFSEILTYKRAKNSLFECKWGVCRKFEGFVGNLEGFAPPPTGKSEFPPLFVSELSSFIDMQYPEFTSHMNND
jgi:hypothetical protein